MDSTAGPGTRLEMKDHATICEYLKDIDRRELIQLGGTLGLDFSKIRRMQYIPEDMIAAWLRREDNVLERSGEPTWKSLIHCLQKIGQKGVAKSIEGDLLQSNVTSDTEQCKGNISVNQSTICSSRVMLLILTMAILLLCCLYCLFWPTLVYKFNLDFHSKTLRDTLENFAGREKDVAYLTKLLDPGSGNIRIVCIVGPPGFGKSALAIHVGHEMVKRNVVVHYIDFVDFQRNHSVQQELAEKVLGSSGISTTSADFNRLLLWARDRYWYHLLILDNCDDAIHYQKHDFQSMLRKLTGASVNVNILITSRTEAIVDKMSIAFPISELSTEAACELLKYREQYGVTLTLDQKKHVANLTGNVPLALDIFKLLLDRIGAPSPDELIRELKEELIETLSPSDFNSSLRITAVLDLSYKHLNPKLQNVSRQLTIFPGSFSLKAGVIVLGYQYVNQTKHNILKDIDESLRCLVRSSLLQYNQRVNRFQYHQLIREYFLHISTTNDTDLLLPAFNFYYAELLMYSCVFFKQRFDVSMTVIDTDRHNFHKLLRNLRTMQLPAVAAGNGELFYKIANAVSNSVQIELLKVRFPRDDLLAALNISLMQFDLIIERATPSSHIHNRSSTEFFHCYVLMMTQLTELMPKGDTSWSNIYTDREHRLKAWQDFINPMDYSKFYQQLTHHYDGIGNGKKVEECRRNIFVHVSVHHDMCTRAKEAQCTYDNIGIAYFDVGDYYMAAELLEKAIKAVESTNTLKRAKLLGYLTDTYKNLKHYKKQFQTAERLRFLCPNITNSTFSELLWEYNTVVKCLEIYEENEFVEEASILYETFVRLFKELVVRRERLDFGCNDRTLLAYKALKRMYEIEEYRAVTEIGSLILVAINKEKNEVFPLSLMFKLLVGKAKFHGKNYSAGLNDIEFVLKGIMQVRDKKLLQTFEKDKEDACWYLIPRFVYINVCYNISAAICSGLFHLIFAPIVYPTSNHVLVTIRTLFDYLHIKASKSQTQFTAIELEEISFFVMRPSVDFWRSIFESLFSGVANTKMFQLAGMVAYHLLVISPIVACIALDALLVWARLILPYIIYLYFKQHWLFEEFVAEILYFLFVLVIVVPVNVIIYIPERSLLFVIRAVRDPRWKYGVDASPYVKLLIDQ